MNATKKWHAAHTPVPGVPRWARILAYAVPLIVLPSSLWRLPLVFDDRTALSERLYILALSVLSELLAFTAFGLVAAWGERLPRWVPGLGGRRLPTPAVAVPAALGAVALTLLWSIAFVGVSSGTTLRGEPVAADFPTQGGALESTIFYACYLPLLLWGPVLAALTYGYCQRRRRRVPQSQLSGAGPVSPGQG